MKKCVFLDRDGTINHDSSYVNSPNDLALLPFVTEGLDMLQKEGYSFVIISNQSGVGREYFTYETLMRIDEKLREILNAHEIHILDSFYATYYWEAKNPLYLKGEFDRKPNPGMILKAVDKYNIDLAVSYMIGDKISDIAAGINAGCKTVLLGDSSDFTIKDIEFKPDFQTSNLLEAAKWILKK